MPSVDTFPDSVSAELLAFFNVNAHTPVSLQGFSWTSEESQFASFSLKRLFVTILHHRSQVCILDVEGFCACFYFCKVNNGKS